MVKLEGLHVVTGAFGYTGRWIAHNLLERGAEVRTLTNSIGRDDPFDGRVEVHRYDFDDRKKLVESLKGASVLYNTYWVRYTVEGQGFAHALDSRMAELDQMLNHSGEEGEGLSADVIQDEATDPGVEWVLHHLCVLLIFLL